MCICRPLKPHQPELLITQRRKQLQVRRHDVSRRYRKQEIGVFVGACPISAPGAPAHE